jgi:hypothetical protein
MNDNEKFKKFFGFGSDGDAAETTQESAGSADASKESLDKAQAAVTEWTDKYLSLTRIFKIIKNVLTMKEQNGLLMLKEKYL